MEKIKEYKVSRQGLRGFAITLPKIWVKDMNLKQGDYIIFYREGEKLILIPERKEGNNG